MKPTVGRIVHYTSYGTPGGEYHSECRAAVVTHVHWDATEDGTGIEEVVSLAVLNPEGMFFNQDVRRQVDAHAPTGGTWHWPEREEG